MSHVSMTMGENQIKEAFKQAIFEVLQEQKDWLSDLFAEVLEDFALVNAIKEGEDSAVVNREEVFKILEGQA